MIFKVNLAACAVFALAFVGVGLFGSDPSLRWTPGDLWILDIVLGKLVAGLLSHRWTSGDFWIVLFSLSPAMVWAAGALVVRRRPWSSSVWLVASAVFLGIELYALVLEAIKYRQEAITRQYTQSFLGFLAVLLQWAAGLLLLAILAVIAEEKD
jgi:hypothetical protein